MMTTRRPMRFNSKFNRKRGQAPEPNTDTNADIGKIVQTKAGSWFNGKLHFYDYTVTLPKTGYINIPYIRDLPSIQAKFVGIPKSRVDALFNEYKKRTRNINAFITMTPTFAEHIKTVYNINVKYGIFMAYPSWEETPSDKRDEIVYIDHSSTVPFGFEEHLDYLHNITTTTGIKTIFSSLKFNDTASSIVNTNKYNVTTIPLTKYDCGSAYGLLMNTNNFNQASECLNRKLLKYLMYGMNPLIHESFVESIRYVKSKDIQPLVYTHINDINIENHNFGSIDKRHFCMAERVPDLKRELIRLTEEIK